jgi:iron transport multicopper oxidase
VYNSAAALPQPFTLERKVWDDTDLIPFEGEPLLGAPTFNIYLTVSINQDAMGSTRSMFNGQTYVAQKVPTMFTALTAPADVIMNPTIYGRATNPYVIPYNAIVEVRNSIANAQNLPLT